jgi:hypothetical protein
VICSKVNKQSISKHLRHFFGNLKVDRMGEKKRKQADGASLASGEDQK